MKQRNAVFFICKKRREKVMNSLGRYKMLSNEDKSNLNMYCIYDSIYDVAKNEDIDLSDDLVQDIKELSYDIYLDDEYMNLSASQIAFFITECYVKDNTFMDKVQDLSYYDIIQAVIDDNYDFYKEDIELERQE